MNHTHNIQSNYERQRQARAKLSRSSKRAVFAALAAANSLAFVSNSKAGATAGQTESVTAYRGEVRRPGRR
jgi:hypothetical protein